MSKPPFAFRILKTFCPDHLYEEIEGDLIQKFKRDEEAIGEKHAVRKLWWNAVRFLRPGILLRNKFSIGLNNPFMLSSYFKTTSRHLAKNKLNFAFKLIGLTFALFSLLVIFTYLSFQFSFDSFHAEDVYRVNSLRSENGNQVPYATVPPAIGPSLHEEFADIDSYARLGIANRVVIQHSDKLFRLTGFAEADSSIFNVLTFDFLLGNKHALDQPGSVVLTKSTAEQIFGDENPMGKAISSPDHQNKMLTVRGIINDYPANSHLRINALHNFGAFLPVNLNSWEISWDGSVYLYMRLKSGVNPDELSVKAQSLLQKNLTPHEDGSEKNFSLYFQPIENIYLSEVLKMEFIKKGNPLYVYLFCLLGVFLLIIAAINYVNLSIADYSLRMREMGVRKILGARKRQLAFQVTFESILFSVSSLLLALGLLYLMFPQIASNLEPNLTFDMVAGKLAVVLTSSTLIGLIVFTSVYHASQIIKQQPIQSLKLSVVFSPTYRSGKLLLGIQYAISIICVCATVVIGKQLTFVQDRDLGYDRSHVISLVMPDEYPPEKVQLLKNEFKQIAGVEAVSYSYYLMPISTYFKDWYQIERNGSLESVLLNEMFVDHDYFETMGIELLRGRGFDINRSSDKEDAFIINETGAREFGWENPIGEKIKVGHSNDSTPTEGTIVGIVKDFHSLSLHKKIEPVILRLQYDSWPGNSLNIKVIGIPEEMIPIITATYEELMPGFLTDVRILNDIFDKQYEAEQKVFVSLQSVSLIVAIISALGIFSLSLFMSVRRMKEFGIRKILGATTQQIAGLHTWHFLKIALFANAVALPVAYLLMKKWLNSFVYQTQLNATVFIGMAVGSIFLAVASTAYASWKAGRMNPVDVIKNQ